jgi:hypothetical protein
VLFCSSNGEAAWEGHPAGGHLSGSVGCLLLEPLTCAALGTRSALEGPSILPSGGGDAVARRRRRVSPQQRQLLAARAPQGCGRGQVRPGQPAWPDLACQ